MKLVLIREIFTEESTIGKLYVDGAFECYVLEDKVRVDDKSTPDVDEGKKVWGQTAIAAGTYEVVITFSNRFQKMMPLLKDVPNYAGIRIHPGNTAADTHGCLLVGQQIGGPNKILKSQAAYWALLAKLEKALQTEKVFIEIR